MEHEIYLDNAATTYVSGEVFSAMQPYFLAHYGNASSAHNLGREAEAAVYKARQAVAALINASADEIFFTSGATESNNWFIKGAIERSAVKRVLVSRIEHPSIMETVEYLGRHGVEVEYINVDEGGIISIPDLLSKLSKPTALVSVMTANNEVGTVQYINTIGKICRDKGVLFHTDATQAVDSITLDVKTMNIDGLSMSGHKIYGPKGVGALYIKKGTQVETFMHGGHQERGKRAGTTDVPCIVGFGKAAEITMRDMSINNARIRMLRDYLIREIEGRIPAVKLNGHRTQRIVSNVNFSFQGIEGESVLTLLDLDGICVSTGSACNSGTLDHSYVLDSMGVSDEMINGSVRFSLGRNTTKEDLDFLIEKLVKIVGNLRKISPIGIKGEL
ncbi:MAG: IscS subfamily cysteine desulfurase [Christensenellaceae bacterium]|jgi:cysteine desulfurase|nr:IscS subfamily cysteine desulfurase [Christensenellaceae bacterium]